MCVPHCSSELHSEFWRILNKKLTVIHSCWKHKCSFLIAKTWSGSSQEKKYKSFLYIFYFIWRHIWVWLENCIKNCMYVSTFMFLDTVLEFQASNGFRKGRFGLSRICLCKIPYRLCLQKLHERTWTWEYTLRMCSDGCFSKVKNLAQKNSLESTSKICTFCANLRHGFYESIGGFCFIFYMDSLHLNGAHPHLGCPIHADSASKKWRHLFFFLCRGFEICSRKIDSNKWDTEQICFLTQNWTAIWTYP